MILHNCYGHMLIPIFIGLLLSILNICTLPEIAYAEPQALNTGDSCEILIYSNITLPPKRERDQRDTCPEGQGNRAFVISRSTVEGIGYLHQGRQTNKKLREVAPQPEQQFRCLTDRKCYLIIRGFNVGIGDAISIQPPGESHCPPNGMEGSSSERDMAVVVSSDRSATLTSSLYPISDVSFAVYELPDRLTLSKGLHTICYAPALSVEFQPLDDIKPSAYHYSAGTLEVDTALYRCTFEEPTLKNEDQNYADPILPCGFKNYRDQFRINLMWNIGTGDTETPGTGPNGDKSPDLEGRGHYLYMDSPGFSLGTPATVVSPPIVFPRGVYCTQFQYHMYGEDVSTLRVYMHGVALNFAAAHEHASNQTILGDWGSPKWVAVANKGNTWHSGGFDFKVDETQTYQVVFEALAGHSEQGDIAIDEVHVTPGRCPAGVRHHIPKSLTSRIGGGNNQPMICGEVRLQTGNHSADKSWFVEGAISCAGKGYTIDNLVNAPWLPCCVPHFGTYNLVLEDGYGDGWTGSELEFRFFDRVMTFGADEFQNSGYHKNYNLVIGSLEIVDVEKPKDKLISISVRVARPNSYVWCGVVQSSNDGKILSVKLEPETLKKYGVRSADSSTQPNELVNVLIGDVLKIDTLYDIYCYSEVVGEKPSEDAAERIQKEIQASRIRVSTDRKPPAISVSEVTANPNIISVNVAISESGAVWCVAERRIRSNIPIEGSEEEPAPPTLVQLLAGPPSEDVEEKISKYFKEYGTSMDILMKPGSEPEPQTLEITGVIPNSFYSVYCYAEDVSTPAPNRSPPTDVAATVHQVKTQAKVPRVTIVRKMTVTKGFRLFVRSDAPGRVWCAAAAADYGSPKTDDVIKVGATVDITDPKSEGTLELRGVEPSTNYILYCVGALIGDDNEIKMTSTAQEMLEGSLAAISYGRYCESEEGMPLYSESKVHNPFHPISPEEEMRIRDYILAQKELGLEGIYRITLLPNKTQIYNHFDNKGPRPKRYARVRAGKCEDGVGYYEQFRVGPLESNTLTYKRLSHPIATDCGGYNPQGVFGRRLLESASSSREDFDRFLMESFGHEFGSVRCEEDPEQKTCLRLGPLILEEICDESTSDCDSNGRSGRVWIGLRTWEGDKIPLYFVHNVKTDLHSKISESAQDWAKRVVHDGFLPDEHEALLQSTEVWYEGKVYQDVHALLEDSAAPRYTPELFSEKLKVKLNQIMEEAQRQRRRLEPMPFPGAAGTAGPLPSRQARRGGLEYRAAPEHIESQGKRFTVEGSDDKESFVINYNGWKLTVANDRDTALKVYDVRFLDQKVAFEFGLMEALAHYSVSETNWFFLDSWYGGLGAAARKVHRGIECPKTAQSLFWDGSLCVFEQDMARPIRAHWKSGEIRDGAPHVALVLRQMLTVSNYDYLTDYRFHPTGMFEGSVSFTGELYAGIEVPWYSARQADYGVQVTGAMRLAALHAHMAVWKIDFDIGAGENYKQNSVLLSEVVADPLRHGANKLKKSFAETEKDTVFYRNDTRALVYEVVDEKLRIFGNYGGYRIIPSPGINPLHHDFELFSGPAAWAKYRAVSTVRKYNELDSTLPRDNKYAHKPAVSLDRYIADDEPARNVDLVTWISDGIFHVPVIEDMPLTIPIGNTLGWLAKPSNMFLEDPSMDLRNSMGGGVNDPGTCAVVRHDIGEIEPLLTNTWRNGREPIRMNAL